MSALPCVGNADVYDALFDDVPAAQRQAAHAKAVSLCGRCPNPCSEKVSSATESRTLVLLPTGWMPPETEGRPDPNPPTIRRSRRTQSDVPVGRDYVAPGKRVQAWARMAAERAAQGWRLPDIALDLCVTQDTVRHLLDLTHRQAAA